MRKTLPIAVGVLLLLTLSSCSREARKARVARRADSYFAAGDLDKAKVEYLNLLRLDPGSPVSHLRLGQIWSEQGAVLRAAPFLLRARELVPDDANNRVRLARIFTVLGRRGDGFAEAMRVLQQAPNNGEAARLAVESASNEEDVKRVEGALERMPKENPDRQLSTALIALRRGNRDAAKQMAETALSANSKSAAAHSLMAMILIAEKQPAKAGDEFRQAAELSPIRSGERVRYAQFQLQTGAPDKAVKILTSISGAAPDFLPAWLLLAEISSSKKKYDEALGFVRNVLSRDSGNLDGMILEARILNAKGETDRAIETLQQADTRYPSFPPIKVELARCYAQKNDLNQASTFVNQALAAKPDYADAILLSAQINLRTGKAQAVIDSIGPFVSKHPENTVTKYLLADAYRVLGKLDDAANIFREQLKTSPNSADACLALGIILEQQKKTDEARQMLERAQQLAPKNSVAVMQLVDLDLAARDFGSAQRRVDDQLRATPDSALLYFLRGKIYGAQSNWLEAETSLKKSLDLNPDLTAAYQLLAATYAASDRLSDASKQLEAAVARAPKNSSLLMSLGVVYEKMRDFEKARDTYEKLVAIAPDFAPGLNNLAFIYTDQVPQIDRAYQLAQKAHSLQPGDSSIADTLGWVMYKKRDYSQAVGLLNDAAAKSPNNPEIAYHIGMCHYMMGQAGAAKAEFERAVNASGDFLGKPDAERRLSLMSQQNAAGLKIEQLESMVSQQPDDVFARVRLADKYRERGRIKDAVAQLEEVRRLNPKHAGANTKLAELYSDQLNQPAKALEYANVARQLSPADIQTLVLVGRISYKAGNYSRAYNILKEASMQSPDDPAVNHALAWAAFSLGKVAETTELMERVAKASAASALSNDAATWLEMMRIEAHASPNESAINEVSTIRNKDPEYAPAQLAEAAIAANNGDTRRAIDLYEKIVARFPEYAPAEKRLAMLYAREPANLAKAYDFAQKARKGLPNDVELVRLQAEISYQRKDYAGALQLFDEASRKQPLTANDLYFKGICSLQSNNNAEARAALTKALANGLQDPLATEAKRTLEAMK